MKVADDGKFELRLEFGRLCLEVDETGGKLAGGRHPTEIRSSHLYRTSQSLVSNSNIEEKYSSF